MYGIDELTNAPVAVLGGGAVGKTVAADCKLAEIRCTFMIWSPLQKRRWQDWRRPELL